jgi:hypothetical protein
MAFMRARFDCSSPSVDFVIGCETNDRAGSLFVLVWLSLPQMTIK